MAFSNVDISLLEDEEEERENIVAKADRLYKAAELAQQKKGNTRVVLELFRDAEEVIAPLFDEAGGKLENLRADELEKVLKGRLFQAVVLAQLEDSPDKWPEVRALSEDVLHFDARNCHARWLRGLALLHGFQAVEEAHIEMRMAVDAARAQGKQLEADQWEADLGLRGRSAKSEPAKSTSSAAAASKPKQQDVVVGSGSSAPSSAAKPESAVRKGFLSKEREGGPGVAAAADDGSTTKARKLEQEKRNREIEQLKAQLETEKQVTQKLKRRLPQQQRRFVESLKELELDMQECLSEPKKSRGDQLHEAEKKLAELVTSMTEAGESLKENKDWTDKQQHKYTDFATELATLREMTSREWREHKDASKKQIAQVRDVTKSLSDMRSVARALREDVKNSIAARSVAEADAGEDAATVRDTMHCFRSLPASTKLAAYAEDAPVLRVALGVTLFGMLAASGILAEGFSVWRCQFACAR